MFTHWMEILHNLDNGYLDWLFHQNVLPLRESTSILSGNCKGFTLEELFNSIKVEVVCLIIHKLS